MYTLTDYLAMLADRTRVSAYRAAIRAAVKAGDRVIELGSGFGYFSIEAARAGAALVDAIDVNPVVHLGPRIAAANGCSDRIRFHHTDIMTFQPEQRADVLIGDLRGPTPFAGRSLEMLIDARRRMLRPGGTMIGSRDVLYCAPAREPASFRRRVSTALASTDGISLAAVAAVALTTPFQCTLESGDLLAPGSSWGEIDYGTIETPHHRGAVEWIPDNALTMDGVAVWFEAHVGGGYSFSTVPGGGATTYSHLFLPFTAPVSIPAGGSLAVNIAAHFVGGHYVWAWSARVRSSDGSESSMIAQNSVPECVLDPAAFGMAL